VKGEISVQQITGKQEVLVGTEIRDERIERQPPDREDTCAPPSEQPTESWI
jgi:hypothetical protein